MNHVIKNGLLACLMALAAQPAIAGGLKITLIQAPGEPPPPPTMVGGGNLKDIMEVAAKNWEKVFNKGGSDWNLTITYGWGITEGAPAYANERMRGQGGDPVRITNSVVKFRNTPVPNTNVFNWYADPNPKDNSEYKVYNSTQVELEDQDFNLLGEINIGRVFTGGTGLAAGRIDLLTVAMHEIGHALGLDSEYSGHRQVDYIYLPITEPRPFAGYVVEMSSGYADHINAFAPLPLMVYDPEPGERQLISGLDALVLGQLSSFDRPNLGEPPGVPKVR